MKQYKSQNSSDNLISDEKTIHIEEERPMVLRRLRTVVLCSVAIAVNCSSGIAAGRGRPDLIDLQVFAKQSIEARRSDYEGRTTAGESIDLHDFKIDGDLTSGRRVSFEHGRVEGLVRSPDMRLVQVDFAGEGQIDPDTLRQASRDLDSLAAKLAALPATLQVSAGTDEDNGIAFTYLKASATQELEVVDLSADQLISAGPGQLQILLHGNETSQLLIRVHGRSVRMRDVGFSLNGGLDPTRVVFLFPDATDLEIALSGGAHDASGTLWGVPGSVVAPDAVLRFAGATVTGQVFVKAIASIAGLPSGQVNRFATKPLCTSAGGFVSSQLLLWAHTDRAPADCSPPIVLRRLD